MSINDRHYAYDLEYSHIIREIKTPISIYSSRTSADGKYVKTEAVWDTGATLSAMSPKIVQELGLSAIDQCYIGGINGEKQSDVVIVSVILPNGMLLTGRRFFVSNIPGADIIIGMDIISMGDFVITNARGKTMFSFVIPTLNNKISFSNIVNNT
ncbi:MAG: retropepsin-like domain-containing protein [Treponema sp.]|nr:retropepsin-like domain-containing protein [Treponema sp.]